MRACLLPAAGVEYRLNTSTTLGIQGADNHPPTVTGTVPWYNPVISLLRRWLPLLPAAEADIHLWHNHQHLLQQLDPVTRRFWGPADVPDNHDGPYAKE